MGSVVEGTLPAHELARFRLSSLSGTESHEACQNDPHSLNMKDSIKEHVLGMFFLGFWFLGTNSQCVLFVSLGPSVLVPNTALR